MSTYSVKVGDVHGNIHEYHSQAFSKADLIAGINQSDSHILEIRSISTFSERFSDLYQRATSRVTTKELIFFTQFLSSMIHSGITLNESLTLVSKQASNPYFKHIVQDVQTKLSAGISFSDSLSAHESVFGTGFVRSVRAGEKSGNLEKVLEQYSKSLQKNLALQKRVVSALIYPAFLITLALVGVSYILTSVIPGFEVFFSDLGTSLPPSTQMVLDASGFLQNNFLLLAILSMSLIAGVGWYLGTDEGSHNFDRLLLKIPFISSLTREYNVALFSRMLLSCLDSGIGLVESTGISSDSLKSNTFRESLHNAGLKIQEGVSFHKALSISSVFPDLWLQLIQIGEASGSLNRLLETAAEFYEKEADNRISFMVSIVEPALLIFILLFIAAILITMFIPILTAAGHVN